MHGEQPTAPTENARRAQEAITRFNERVDQIRADSRLTEQAKAEDITRLHDEVGTRVDGYLAADRTDMDSRRAQLERAAFGLGAGAVVGSDAISMRDAADRAAKLQRPEEALELLRRAQNNGDATLEKAVAVEAYRNNWLPVLTPYISAHPEFKPQLEELNLIQRLGEDWNYVLWFQVPRPAEAAGRRSTTAQVG